MKKNLWAILIVFAILLTACGKQAAPEAIPTIALGNNNPVPGSQPVNADFVSASAVVVPIHQARLSFSSFGRIKSVDVKVGDEVRAGQTLVQLDTAILDAKVREAEANLTAAKVQVKYLKRVGTDPVHLESAEAEVDRAQALVDSANATLLSQSELAAPFDGIVASIDISPGETATPGQIVIVLGDLSRYQIETTDLSERDVPRVQAGQLASVSIDALDEKFAGRVADISRVSSTLGGDVVFKVTIELDEQPQGLLWGMSADVEIETGK